MSNKFDHQKKSFQIKEVAKKLGYDMKLSHAQTLIANLFGFDSREAMLNSIDKQDLDKYKFNQNQYENDLKNGVFNNQFNLGYSKDKQNWLLKNFEHEPNALFVGGMGSGKSMSAYFTVQTWMLANSHKTILIVADHLKGANDFSSLFKYQQVISNINSDAKVIKVIDLLYDEAVSRKSLFEKVQAAKISDYERITGNTLTRVLTVLEEFHTIPYSVLDFDRNYKKEGTTAWKFHQLMKIGRALGIWFIACASRGTKSDIHDEIIPNFTQKQIFRVSKAEAAYFLADFKAAEIRIDQRGRCETEEGSVQFPYVNSSENEKLLKKYIKPLTSQMLELTPELIKEQMLVIDKMPVTKSKQIVNNIYDVCFPSFLSYYVRNGFNVKENKNDFYSLYVQNNNVKFHIFMVKDINEYKQLILNKDFINIKEKVFLYIDDKKNDISNNLSNVQILDKEDLNIALEYYSKH